jgi:hypothetical protein
VSLRVDEKKGNERLCDGEGNKAVVENKVALRPDLVILRIT